jgi:shikimate kinase
MHKSGNLFFIGPTGAGKTTIGKRAAGYFGLQFHDLDHAIENRTGADVALIFDIEGEAGFRKRESDLLEELTNKRGIVLATGGGAILDPVNRRHLQARGFVIYLQTTIERQIERLSRDKRRPLLRSANRNEILEKMATQRNPIYTETADLVIPSESVSVAVMARKVIQHIERATKDLAG